MHERRLPAARAALARAPVASTVGRVKGRRLAPGRRQGSAVEYGVDAPNEAWQGFRIAQIGGFEGDGVARPIVRRRIDCGRWRARASLPSRGQRPRGGRDSRLRQ